VLIICCFIASAVGCAARDPASGSRRGGFFAELGGERTSRGVIVVDERSGTFAGVKLGMPFAKAKAKLPSRYYFSALTPGSDAIYCSRRASRDVCTGVSVHVFAGCVDKFCLRAKAGPVVRVDVSATTTPRAIPGSRSIATLKGLGLGTPAAEIRKRYSVAAQRGAPCADDVPGRASVFIVLEGERTLIFQTADKVIWSITLLAGRHPNFCG
jgi:hypothetical protein